MCLGIIIIILFKWSLELFIILQLIKHIIASKFVILLLNKAQNKKIYIIEREKKITDLFVYRFLLYFAILPYKYKYHHQKEMKKEEEKKEGYNRINKLELNKSSVFMILI